MKLDQNQVVQRVSRYMTERLLPVASTAGKLKIGFALPLVPQMVNQYWHVGHDLGLVDDAGLDTDIFASCVNSGVEKSGSISIQGFTFHADDVKDFFACLNS